MSNEQERKAFEEMMLNLLSKMQVKENSNEPIFVTGEKGKQILGDRQAGFNVISNEVLND